MNVPGQVLAVCRTLHRNGFQSYLVGGCVRDSLIEKKPKDWDVATDATPDQVESIFEKTIPTGKQYGTITVQIQHVSVEVTTFRSDGNYSDGRRPDSVTFSRSIEEDLSRRDFTMNAIAWDPLSDQWVDPYDGRNALAQGMIVAVRDPNERITEDALRMLRAIRFTVYLDDLIPWSLDDSLIEAIKTNAHLVKNVSNERIRDELSKMITTYWADYVIVMLEDYGLLAHILPEISALKGVGQPEKWHAYDVFTHTLGVLSRTQPTLIQRLAALFHDSGKVTTRTEDEHGVHFYGHEREGAKLAQQALTRLRFSSDVIEQVQVLIMHHMFQFDKSKNKDKTMRKLIASLDGKADIWDLIDLRKADRSRAARGPQFEDYDDTELRECAKRVILSGACLKPEDMAISGNDIMEVCEIEPGPMVGEIKKRLFKTVLSDPTMNNRDYLLRRAAGEYKQLLREKEGA